MKGLGAVLATAAIFATKVLAQDVDPIVIKGSKFFYKTNGTQFYIKGIAYQQEFSTNTTGSGSDTPGESTSTDYRDPLADADQCRRDVPYLQQLGINTIRTYAINPDNNHDECMSLLAAAGIYVVSDLSAPGDSINRNSPSWNDGLYARYTSVVDNLQKYNNVLGFFAGNEVSNNKTNTNASAFVKAAIRDTKAYIKQQGYRTIGVGYATNDDPDIREDLANYFDCGDREQAMDFWGYNIYSWCGDSSFQESGFDVRTEEFSKFDVPVFFAEYGCIQPKPREFTEVEALYGPDMNDVWSGGIVYMYFQEANDYGIVTVDGNSVSTLDDYNNLQSQLAKVTATGVNAGSYNPTNTAAQSCPSVNSDWAASEKLPPTPNQELCSCMYNALSCVSNNVDEEEIGDLFGYVCGLGDGSCDGITANTTTGVYGAYGMCNATEQLGWVLNTYYRKQQAAGNGASACNFGGSATLKSAVSPTAQCSSLIAQAGSDGRGSVTASPSGAGGSGGSSGSGNAAPRFGTQAVHVGYLQVASYVAVAFLSGMGMILL